MARSAPNPDDSEQHSGTTLHPVPGIELTSDVNHEVRVGRVVFLSRDALLRRYRRHGLTRMHVDVLSGKEQWLDAHESYARWPTYAVVRTSSTRKGDLAKADLLVREAIFLLASSQASASAAYRRNAKAFGQVRGASVSSANSFTLRAGGGMATRWGLSGQPNPLRLDANWKQKRKWHFWWPLMVALFGKTRVGTNYRARLRRAAVVMGQSTFSDSISQAFLLNVIALEALVCKRGESISSQLSDVLWALHHWAVRVDRKVLNKQIADLYALRCKVVHEGDLSDITVEHLSLSDALVFNTINNICRARFRSISEIGDFAARVRAYEALDLRPKRLPKQLRWVGSSFTSSSANLLRERLLP